jgi:hypothetical protein
MAEINALLPIVYPSLQSDIKKLLSPSKEHSFNDDLHTCKHPFTRDIAIKHPLVTVVIDFTLCLKRLSPISLHSFTLFTLQLVFRRTIKTKTLANCTNFAIHNPSYFRIAVTSVHVNVNMISSKTMTLGPKRAKLLSIRYFS